MIRLICTFTIIALLTSCGGQKTNGSDSDTTMQPVMTANADSLYRYVADQVGFGPRTPGSAGHEACRQYIAGKLGEFGADTILLHEAPVTTYLNDNFTAYNIMGQFNPGARKRLLLVASPGGDDRKTSRHSLASPTWMLCVYSPALGSANTRFVSFPRWSL